MKKYLVYGLIFAVCFSVYAMIGGTKTAQDIPPEPVSIALKNM